MKNWTPDAAQHFERWLGGVTRSVAGDPSINAEEVAQDLRAHVHAEFESSTEPVTVAALDRVLAGLGNPAQWTEGGTGMSRTLRMSVSDAIAGSQKALAGEWGLPVLLALLTLGALPVFDDGGAFVVGLTYFIARAQVVHAPHRLVGRQKYLVYVPLAIGAGLLAGLVLAFPLIMSIGTFRGVRTISYFNAMYELIAMTGVWWVILGFMAAREPKRVQSALRPFADSFEPAHGRFLMAIGAAFLIVAAVMLVGD